MNSAEYIALLKYAKKLADDGYISSSEGGDGIEEGAVVLGYSGAGDMLYNCN